MAEMDGPRVAVAEGAERWMELGWVRSGMRIGKDDGDDNLNAGYLLRNCQTQSIP